MRRIFKNLKQNIPIPQHSKRLLNNIKFCAMAILTQISLVFFRVLCARGDSPTTALEYMFFKHFNDRLNYFNGFDFLS